MTEFNTDDSDDGPDGAAPAATIGDPAKGSFEFPDNAVDIIGLLLDPDIRAARDRTHAKIEAGQIGQGGIHIEGAGVQNRGLTNGAEVVAKAVTDIHAIQKQAQRNRAQRR